MKDLKIAYAMKQKAKKMARGGMVDSARREAQYNADEDEAHLVVPMNRQESLKRSDEYHSIVDRIMSKRKGMADGGAVGEDPDTRADEMSSEYDYLSVGDLDDSSDNSGASDGDFLGNEQEDQDRKDIVSMIMRKRAKQHNPRPA